MRGFNIARHAGAIFTVISTGLTGLAAATIAATYAPPAIAYNFGEETVNADEFILVAAPIGDRAHQLLILRQVTNERPCWSESGGRVDPLLLSFDFTGICARSTDSNGYSLRMSGQDLGMDYSLRVIPSGNSLMLMAVSDRSGLRIPIGQTDSVVSGFAKIYLYPGWYISQRSYEGQALGHFYVTHQQDLNSFIAASSQPGRPFSIPAQPSTIPSDAPSPAPLAQDSSSSVAPSSAPMLTNPSTLPPSASDTDNTVGNEGWIEFTPPQTAAPSQSSPNLPEPSDIVVVPNVLPPTGQSTIAPPAQSVSTSRASQLGFSYRVIVDTTTPQQEAEVRSLVPDAFRTRLGDRMVMQAGLFETQSEASQLHQQLVQRGLNASVLPVE